MGARGPQPKPAALRMLEGSRPRVAYNATDGMNPDVAIPDPPAWLNRDARKEWKRASEELFLLGCIAKIDRSKFAIYCQSWGMLCQLEVAFAKHQAHALGQAEAAGVDPEIALTQPFFAKTPTGFLRDSQLVRQIGELREQVHRYAASFGLDPSSRSRVRPSDGQLTLPGLGDTAAAANDSGPPTLRSFA